MFLLYLLCHAVKIDFLMLKDVILVDILSNIIYKFQCSSCNAIYVGKTDRNFYVRKNEHQGTSYRTDCNITIGPRSAVMEHLLSHNHTADHANFSVLYKCNKSIGTSIIESLLISNLKPYLNNGTSIALNIFTLDHSLYIHRVQCIFILLFTCHVYKYILFPSSLVSMCLMPLL